jgi:hypothetical protein
MKTGGFLRTFIILFLITAVLWALLWSLVFSAMMGEEFSQVLPVGIYGGIAFGLLFSLIMSFFMKSATISLTFRDKADFLARLNIALAEIGYHPESQAENFLTYKPSVKAGLLAGKISVQIIDSSLTIVGPKTYIKKLQTKFC